MTVSLGLAIGCCGLVLFGRGCTFVRRTHTCAFYLFCFSNVGSTLALAGGGYPRRVWAFVFHHSCSCVVDADSFVHPLRLYTFFYCMESRVLVLLVSHSLAGWVIVRFRRSGLFHRVDSLLNKGMAC